MWNRENGLESFRKWIRFISCFLLIWTGWTGVSILPELQAQKCSSFTLTKTAPMHTCASCKHPTYAFICFYLALQILPMWFFLVACFSTHCLFCHFTLSRSGLSRFPPLVTWPSVPLCSLKHIALINSLSIYNPSSLCLSCQIAIGYLYTPNRIEMPQINIPIRISRPERAGINPFVNWLQDKLITDCFLAVFLQRMPSVLM